MARFPFGIPNSWYLVAYADEFEESTVKSLPYLGRNMIAIRDANGAVSVLEGYCPHLGGNLAVGGTCENGIVRCPFHGWKYDATGRCVEIPYAKRIPKGAALDRFPGERKRVGRLVSWPQRRRWMKRVKGS